MTRAGFRWTVGGLLVVGGAFRSGLALHVLRAQGFAWDLSTLGVGILGCVLMLTAWSLSAYVDGAASRFPVVEDILGLAWQYFATAALFPYMSVNAFNPWALAGTHPMAQKFETLDVVWLSDGYSVLGPPPEFYGFSGPTMPVLGELDHRAVILDIVAVTLAVVGLLAQIVRENHTAPRLAALQLDAKG